MFGFNKNKRKENKMQEQIKKSQELIQKDNETALREQKEYVENMTRINQRVEDVLIDEGIKMKDFDFVVKYFQSRNTLVFNEVKFSEIKEELDKKKKEAELKATERSADGNSEQEQK